MLEIELGSFSKLIIHLVDLGEREDLEVIEDKQKNIVDYITEKYSKKYGDLPIFNDLHNKSIQKFISEQYISIEEMKAEGIENNGLLYLVQIIINNISASSLDEEVSEDEE